MTKKINKFDFLIIGAQKSGTTTVHEWLIKNDDVYLPGEKELPFFSDSDRYNNGIDSFFNKYIEIKSDDVLVGKVSPQYMYSSRACENIFFHNPNIKIIAILRDPIDRACSHYKMNIRRRVEKLDINERVEKCLTKELVEETESDGESDNIVKWSEYGDQLQIYFEKFGLDRILLLDFVDITDNPEEAHLKIANFLNVSKSLPQNIKNIYHAGGSRTKLPPINKLKKYKKFWALRMLLSEKIRRNVMKKYSFWNIKTDNVDYKKQLTDKNINELKRHFRQDLVKVKDEIKQYKIRSLEKYLK